MNVAMFSTVSNRGSSLFARNLQLMQHPWWYCEEAGKFHSYEDEIVAVKMQYNQEQMWHIMDEAKEIGEKIAEEAEKFEPKTAEERYI